MHSVPIIETDRLILRPYRRDDFPSYVALFGDAEVIRYVGGVPFTREQSWTRFLRQVGMWHYFGFGFFAIQDRQSGTFLGEAGFHDVHRAITPSLEGTMETGWALSPKAHGRGLATEAVSAALYLYARSGDDFRATVLTAANQGGAASTIGAVAGALSGAWLGASALPLDLVEAFDARMYLLMAAPALLRVAQMRAGLFLHLQQLS